MATVTFVKPIDHYAPGDVRDITKDEKKRLEEYAKRWKITDYLVEGKQTLEAPKAAPKPSKTTATVSSDGTKTTKKKAAPKAPKQPAAPVTTPEGGKPKEGEDETDPAVDLPPVDGTVAKDGDNDPEPASKPGEDETDEKK